MKMSETWARFTAAADQLIAEGDAASARCLLSAVSYSQKYSRPDGTRIVHDPDTAAPVRA